MKTSLAIVVACIWVLPRVATAQDGPYKFKLDKPYHYTLSADMETVMEVMGQTVTVKTDFSGKVTLRADKRLDAGRMHCLLTVDDAKISVESPTGPQTLGPEMAGRVLGLVITPKGAVEERDSGFANLKNELRQTAAYMEQIVQNFGSGILEGHEWSVALSDTIGGGDAPMMKRSVTQFTSGERTALLGRECLLIHTKGTTEAKGTTSTMGMELHIDSKGTSKGTIHFDLEEGVIVQSVTEITTEQTIGGVSAAGGDIPSTASTTMTVTLDPH
jgi:hypothetical protein